MIRINIYITIHFSTINFSSKSSNIALGGGNMIKTSAMLMDELKNFVNPTSKIHRLVEKGELVPIVRGLYETDKNIP